MHYRYLVILLTALLIFILTDCSGVTSKAAQRYTPHLNDNVSYLDTADNGFSRGWRGHERADPMAWFDAHTHLNKKCTTLALAKEAIDFWRKEFGFTDITGAAIIGFPGSGLFDYAPTDTSIAAYVWLLPDNPDIKLIDSLYREKRIKGVKLHMRKIYGSGLDYKIMDSKEWHAVYEKCGQLGIPILWHLNQRHSSPELVYGEDKSNTWQKLNYTNADVLKWFETVAKRHSKTNIILAHFNFMGYDSLGALLDRHPNIYTDGSSAWLIGEYHTLTDREKSLIGSFAIKYQDRIMFASDFSYHVPDPLKSTRYRVEHYQSGIRFIMQLELPSKVLSKIAYRNALKILNMNQSFVGF
ncbi:MAG: amidohydrolase family protein [Fibrobacteres bacterium]|nr:amidohydrolase family protein [Fibrobacterota bacterium]